MAIVLNLVALLATLAGACGVGLAASGSESDGVTATYVAAFPLGALWAAGIGSLLGTAFLRGGAKVAAPLGCGCLGGILMLGCAGVFFSAIFPAL